MYAYQRLTAIVTLGLASKIEMYRNELLVLNQNVIRLN